MAESTTESKGTMDDEDLKASIKNLILSSTGYLGGEITEQRRIAMRDYLSEPMGNEIEGRSQVISSDVQDTVEGTLPDLIQVFTSSDRAVEFAPVGQEDEEAAEQATDYVNHIWNVDNDGFNIFYDWFKDALLQINGIIKIWWDDTPKVERRQYTGLSSDQVALLMDEDGVEVIEHEEYWPEKTIDWFGENGVDYKADDFDMGPSSDLAGKQHDLTIKRTAPNGRVKIMNVAPEDFVISRQAISLDDTPFVAHRTEPTESDLIEAGYDKDQIEGLPDEDGHEYNEERVERFNREDEFPFNEQEIDRSMREIQVYECYVKVDWDNDGIAELRKITVAGPHYDILKFKDGTLDNELIADHPFESITPIRMPHKFFGRSLAELVQDIQYLKTSLWRSGLDNAYNINNGRAAISNKVSLDDYLDNKVGSPIRVDTDVADTGGHITPIVTASIGNTIFPLLEYADTVRETRTGITRLGQGLDPDALNSTASGINQLLGQAEQRKLLIAQVFANGGVKGAFRKILKLISAHQDRARAIRLRNEWVEIDPRTWNTDMNVTINVGLGRGTQQQRMHSMQILQQSQDRIIAYQGGVNGPLVRMNHVQKATQELMEATGIKSTEPYMADMSEDEGKQLTQQAGQQPNPEAEAAQAEMQIKQQDSQATLQLKAQEGEIQSQLKMVEMENKRAAEEEKAQLDREKAEADAQLNREVAVEQAELAREVAYAQLELEREKAGLTAEIQRQDIEIKREDTELRRQTDSDNTANKDASEAKDKKITEAKEKKAAKASESAKNEPVVVNLNVNESAKKRIDIQRDGAGKISGAEVTGE